MNVKELREQLDVLDRDQRVEIEYLGVTMPIDAVRECTWVDDETGKAVVLLVADA